MAHRPIRLSRRIACVAALALSVTGVACTGAPAHAATCLQVEVASSAGEFCVTPTPPPGTSVSTSGSTTVTNHLPVPVKVKGDTGETVTVPPSETEIHTYCDNSGCHTYVSPSL
ncbi:hypothetical protein GCM10022403_018860 [Streptomyces coacervatus]|uniref:Uncharacterized protein n=1 Tax=Streptomyces coacervatus TaxID=647381 RepID=A0ABP7H7D8_9ACTN